MADPIPPCPEARSRPPPIEGPPNVPSPRAPPILEGLRACALLPLLARALWRGIRQVRIGRHFAQKKGPAIPWERKWERKTAIRVLGGRPRRAPSPASPSARSMGDI